MLVEMALTLTVSNDSCASRFGFSAEEMLGKTTSELGMWADQADRERFLEELDRRGKVSNMEGEFREKGGRIFPGFISGQVIDAGGQRLIMNVVHDGTDRKLALERLETLSSRDPLTGVLNYRAFYAEASQRMLAASGSQFALIYMDLDHLKEINDTCGHSAGDQALVLFAEVLCEAFRDSDVIGRLGGDEFAVLAVSRDEVSDEVLMRRFSEALRERNLGTGLPYEVCASAGIVWWGPADEGADLQRLIGVADARMYEAKRSAGPVVMKPDAVQPGARAQDP